MAVLLVVYGVPSNPARFDAYYRDIHVPLVEKIPHLKGVTLSKDSPLALAGDPVHLVAMLKFDDLATLQAALASPDGSAAAADTANFADGGIRIIAFDEKRLI
jgi:uncharacterized protein (TIGR02118 family)